ncbi:MAG: DUF3327 domain-containing protein [Pseudomonas aeruginosa]|nr:DUF3327 domain-containing protein [Pseudomonas aeruginosa]
MEVDRGRVRLRATTPDGKALRATELAGRQSLGLQAGERQGLRLTFSADEDTALTLTPTQRLTPQTPALDSPAPQSPTLQRLQAELAEKRPGALKAFWKQVAKQGTPLVEPLDAERVLVTFLWRQQRPGDVRLLWPTPEVNTRRFEALAGSDIRYLSLPLRRDARVSYQLSADLPDLQQADRGTLRLALQAAARPDPLSRTPWLNSRALPRAEQASLVQLGGAPAETWDQPRKDVPRGKVERLGYSSQALANQRQLTLYTPPGYDPEGQRYPLLVFAPRGPEQEGLLAIAEDMRQRGAQVLLAAPDDIAERDLPLQRAAHPALDPILAIQSFYVMAAGLAEARGMDPDQPRHLSKVTRTH